MINKCRSISLLKLLVLLSFATSCASYQKFKHITEEFEMPSKVYKADFNQSWKAILAVMKKYDLSLQNIESGVIKTRWMDNTSELNFADHFGSSGAVKAAKFKLVVNLVKGFKSGREVSKITVYRRQLVEQDFLQGWKEIPSDGIHEKVILYRIDRMLTIDNKMKKIEDAKVQEQLNEEI